MERRALFEALGLVKQKRNRRQAKWKNETMDTKREDETAARSTIFLK